MSYQLKASLLLKINKRCEQNCKCEEKLDLEIKPLLYLISPFKTQGEKCIIVHPIFKNNCRASKSSSEKYFISILRMWLHLYPYGSLSGSPRGKSKFQVRCFHASLFFLHNGKEAGKEGGKSIILLSHTAGCCKSLKFLESTLHGKVVITEKF